MTPERLAEIRRLVNKYGPSNCWTGTLGTLCAAMYELLAEIDRLNQNAAQGVNREGK